ncbi:MAG: NRDE family protein [Cyclobacteriaceae bacterium]|nr:NRDE family protein [Cyclobacteriaceae bacterium]
MCLIFLALNQHPDYKLVIAANRDEFYKRKTVPAHFWEEQPHILGGRDLEAGGTWMGISRQGKISMVTNYRDLKNLKQVAPSRGQLVSDYLLNGDKPDEFLQTVAQHGHDYNGFNLVLGYPDELHYYSNYGNGVERVPEGIHGLSNHLLNTPWPKVEKGKKKFSAVLESKAINTNHLFDLLYDDQLAQDNQLPDTGVSLEFERVLSSMFIKSPGYGTRCSTVLLVDRGNNVQFTERVYNVNTPGYSTHEFSFAIE